MTTKTLVTQYLEATPLARERKNRSRAIWRILQAKYHDFDTIDLDHFLMWQPEMESISRLIRQIQEERTDLRGKDYGDKVTLEQSTMLSLGYSPNYHADIKKLQTL
jgi:hypothetical protein